MYAVPVKFLSFVGLRPVSADNQDSHSEFTPTSIQYPNRARVSANPESRKTLHLKLYLAMLNKWDSEEQSPDAVVYRLHSRIGFAGCGFDVVPGLADRSTPDSVIGDFMSGIGGRRCSLLCRAFGWDTLVVDYLLFALLSGVVLGGTLSTAQARAEAKGETLPDAEQGWPGPQDLTFFGVVAMIIVIPLVNLPLPLGSHGQLLGFQTLIIRFGESFTSLAPFYPEIIVLYSPGFHAFSAYLSQQLGQSIPIIQMSITAVVIYLSIWLAYDLGAELRDKRLGRAMAIAMLLCGGVFISYLDAHYTELIALLFMMAFLMYSLRFMRQFNLADMIAGGLMMGAVVYTNLTMSIILILGFIPLCVLTWLTHQPNKSSIEMMKLRIGLTFGFPIVALIGISPWLLKNLGLMFPIVPSPFTPDIELLHMMTIGQGLVIIPLALWGAVVGLRSQDDQDTRLVTILMLVWLALIIEFALFGVIGRMFPFIGDLVNAPNLARHGVIIPCVWLGGLGILNLWETQISKPFRSQLREYAYVFIAIMGIIVAIIGLAFNPILESVRGIFHLPQETATSDDIAVMTWIKDNTTDDAILYTPDEHGWLPVFAERNALNFRAVHYFEWNEVPPPAEMIDFDPSDLSDAEFDYVFVSSADKRDLSSVDALQLIFEQGQARVYQVK